MPLVYQQNINDNTKIAVWHIAEDEDFFLNKVPLQREISHWHKRLQHLAGRLLLTKLFPDFPLSLIKIADSKKPFLQNEPFHFSISHCGDYAAAIVSKTFRVGVDVELITDKIQNLQSKFMFAQELTMLQQQCSMGLSQSLTLYWSVKETVFKWWGLGKIDFKKDIQLYFIEGDPTYGIVNCKFRTTHLLTINYLLLNDNYLTWVIT